LVRKETREVGEAGHASQTTMNQRRGLSLAELITAFALSLILLYLVTNMFSFMRQAFEQSDGRIVLQQRARIAFSRITPLLVTAIAPDDATQAVDFPPVVASFEALGEDRLSFYSPIDHFGNPVLPRSRNTKFYHYEIHLNEGQLLFRDLDRKRLKHKLLASGLDSFLVRRVQLNAVNLEIGVRLKKTGKEFRLETLVQLPYYSN
jgi:hypothetical protein